MSDSFSVCLPSFSMSVSQLLSLCRFFMPQICLVTSMSLCPLLALCLMLLCFPHLVSFLFFPASRLSLCPSASWAVLKSFLLFVFLSFCESFAAGLCCPSLLFSYKDCTVTWGARRDGRGPVWAVMYTHTNTHTRTHTHTPPPSLSAATRCLWDLVDGELCRWHITESALVSLCIYMYVCLLVFCCVCVAMFVRIDLFVLICVCVCVCVYVFVHWSIQLSAFHLPVSVANKHLPTCTHSQFNW